MVAVCHQCGMYHPDKVIDPEGPYAICPECGYKHLFLQLPLFMVSGASGAGKTSVYNKLLGQMNEFVLLESDILWRAEFNSPENRYRNYMETWLALCMMIGQSGRPVMLFGAGSGVPENIEPCVQRRYFSKVHYLALVCDEDLLEQRLLSRPDWRGCKEPRFIDAQKTFNRWFKEYDNQRQACRIDLLDTTHETIEEIAVKVKSWGLGLYI